MNKNIKLTKNNVLLIAVAGLASYMDAALLVSLGVALPIWAKYLKLNSLVIGLLSTLLTIAVALGSFIGGWLSDKFGRVKVFNADIICLSIGSFIIAFSNDLPILITGIIIAGVASGADLPTSLSVISERVSDKVYGRAISITQIFWTIGILLSQFIGFLTADFGYKSPTVLFGWIGLVAFLNWCFRVFSIKFKNIENNLNNKNSTNVSSNSNNYMSIKALTNKELLLPLILLTIFYLFWNLPANTWGSFVNYFLVTVDNRSQAYSTIIALIANIFCLIVNIFYLKISDTKYRYPIMYLGIIIALVSFVVAGIFNQYWQIFTISYVLYSGSTVLCGEALYKIWSQTFYPIDYRATLTGFSYGIVRIFTAAFSLFTPTIMTYSPRLLLWIMVGCTVIFGGCALLIVHFIKKLSLKI